MQKMPGKTGKRNWRINNGAIWLVAGIIFASDFFIKSYLRQTFPSQSIPLIKNILHLTVVFNPGAAFGILKGKTTLLAYTSIFFIIFFLSFIKRENNKNLLFLIACGLIIGGAASNLYDRIFLGYVVDYIDVRVWPVFNLSDASINTGAGLLLIDSFRKSRAKQTL